MHFNGVKLEALATGEVTLPRPGANPQALKFKVRAIGFGEEGRGALLFPDERVPMDFVYDKAQNIVRDPMTNKVLREPNFHDPGYLDRQAKAVNMQLTVLAVDALDQSGITWETKHAPGTREFYLDCSKELKEAGLSLGDIRLVIDKARELGNLDSKKLEEAAASF